MAFSSWFYAAVLFGVGALSAFQPSVNARLADRVGGFLPSALVSFSVGTVILLTVVLGSGRASELRSVGSAPWWELTGGLIGAAYVSATILAFPRLGTAAGMATVIAAQLTAGLVLDHFGAFGFRTIPVDFRRLTGVALLFAGAYLVVRR